MEIFSELYKYREFLKTSIKKEFRGKYKKSFLGVIWSFLNPLFQLLIYAFVFPFILKNDVDNYIVFLIVALMPWTFFNSTVVSSAASIVTNGGIIKKVYFPRVILPISTTTSNLINFGWSFVYKRYWFVICSYYVTFNYSYSIYFTTWSCFYLFVNNCICEGCGVYY